MEPEPVAEPGSDVGPGPAAAGKPAGATLGYGPLLLLYTLARVALIAVLALGLSFLMVPLVALAFAVVLQLPLAWFLFAPLRRRVNEAGAVARAKSRAEREELRRELAGDES